MVQEVKGQKKQVMQALLRNHGAMTGAELKEIGERGRKEEELEK